MRDEAFAEARDNPNHDGGIRTAVGVWFADPAAAKAKYGPIASWDTSGITRMNALFIGKEDFNEDISRWNVSNVVNMDWMFAAATSFTGDLSSWEVGQVEDMSYMFYGATSFTGDLSNWDVGQVKTMASMFHGATSFTHQLGGAWPTSMADKYEMFRNSPGTIAGKVK
jgi:surface protein